MQLFDDLTQGSLQKFGYYKPKTLHLQKISKKDNEGNYKVPFSYIANNVKMDSRINEIITLVETLITDPYFLVSAKIKPTNNIKLFLDGDQGITIETCVKINRQLYKIIEEKANKKAGEVLHKLKKASILLSKFIA